MGLVQLFPRVPDEGCGFVQSFGVADNMQAIAKLDTKVRPSRDLHTASLNAGHNNSTERAQRQLAQRFPSTSLRVTRRCRNSIRAGVCIRSTLETFPTIR